MTRAFTPLLRLALAPALGVAACLPSCADPVHDDAVKALGKEFKNVPVGELHRAGQPCVTCHGPEGPAKTTFSVAGTVFAGPRSPVGVDQVEVQMVDSAQSQFIAHTNCVGNFYVTPDQWSPAFPILARLVKGSASQAMTSPISREGSCGACHGLVIPPEDATSTMPWVTLFDGPEPGGPTTSCGVQPDLTKP
jgi:hypothetical protein